MLAKKILARSIAWSVAENASLALTSVGTLLVLTRFLSPVDFGVFAVASSLTELLAIFTAMFFHDAIIQRPDIADRHIDTAFTVTLLGAIVIAVGLALIIPWAPILTREAKLVTLALTFAIPISASTSTIVAAERRAFNFRKLAVRSLAGRLIGAGVALGSTALGFGVWSLVFQQIATVTFSSAVLWILAERKPRLKLDAAALRAMLPFAAASITTLILTIGGRRVFLIISGALLGAEKTGYINLAFRLVDTLWSLTATAINQVALAMFSKSSDDPAGMIRAYESAFLLSCGTMFPMFFGLAATSKVVIAVTSGANWLPAALPMTFLAGLIVVLVPRLLGSSLLTAIGAPLDVAKAQGFAMIGLPIVLIIGRPDTVLVCVAAWCAAETLSIVPLARSLHRRELMVLSSLGGPLVKPLCGSLLMAAVTIWSGQSVLSGSGAVLRLASEVAVGVVTYAIYTVLFQKRFLMLIFDVARSSRA